MIAEGLQKLADLIKTETISVAGARADLVSTRQLYNLPLPEEPGYPTARLTTLDGLLEFVYLNPGLGKFIRCAATSVELVGDEFGIKRQRDVYASVTCPAPAFQFGNHIDLETFRVQLLTRFVPTDDSEQILKFISSLNDESARSISDDGVSQSVAARVGVASMAKVDVPSPCALRPIRTFCEIEQPLGTFVFRLKKNNAGNLEAALFEVYTDWQRAAAIDLVDYLKARLSARGSQAIPVIA